jgi:hypothetical protein
MESFREEQSGTQSSYGGGDSSAESVLAAFRSRARHLLQIQRQRVFHVETQLMSRVQAVLDELHDARCRSAKLLRETQNLREACDQGESGLNLGERDGSQEFAELQRQLLELSAERDELKELVHAQSQGLMNAGGGTDQEQAGDLREQLEFAAQEIRDLQAENEELKKRALASGNESGDGTDPDRADLQQRFELAVQEVRELKDENAELKTRLATAARPGAAAPNRAVAGFDWESQKKMLLEQLESDFCVDDPAQKNDRLTVEGAIRITDQVVAEKDRELSELRRLLENQSSNLGSVAVGAAALEQILDHDDLVREKKEQLLQLQEEWREKLRRAEVEISVERAKIARERLELEDKLRSLHIPQPDGTAGSVDPSLFEKGKNRPRSRWLTRLGLQEDQV